jgi:hypothetical protein
VKPFRWNHQKNEELKAQRQISFEEIVLAIEADGLRDILRHPNPVRYPRQFVFVVAVGDYAYLVPFVEEDDHYFLKTIIPSRKATRGYLRKGEEDEEA